MLRTHPSNQDKDKKMDSDHKKKVTLKDFPKVFWIAIMFEFFERGSYYGVMSVLSIYLVMDIAQGGLGFSKESVGVIKSTLQPLLYLLPIISGAIGDRFGYRKTFLVAFTLLSVGYLLTSQMTSYGFVFASLLFMGIGAGTFKPIVSGTIARVTDERTSTLGFGIFYWSINLGAFLFPLILVPILKEISWSYVFIMAAVGTGLMIIPTILFYKEPPKPESTKTLPQVLAGMVMVLKDFRFITMIIIYSGFWVLYFQQFDTVLYYLRDYVNMTAVNDVVNGFLGIFGIHSSWKFDVEHVTVINAGTIILLQILVSKIVTKRKALPTMITGMTLGSIGMGVLAISTSPWIFLIGLIVFSIGEMTAHPKYISYCGLIAPKDKVATYLGYGFLYGVIGSAIGGYFGAKLYVHFVDQLHNPQIFWLIFCAFGFLTIIGLLLYHKFLAPKETTS